MAGNNDLKIQRNYVLTVQSASTPADGVDPATVGPQHNIVIVSPQPDVMPNLYTLEFDIVTDISNSGSATFRIYNLSQNTRTAILRDYVATAGWQRIEFRAGYGLGVKFPIVFSGYVSSCTSSREGTNVITTINCLNFDTQSDSLQYDGNSLSGSNNSAIEQVVNNAITQSTAGASTSLSTPILSLGAIGNFQGSTPAGQSHTGNTIDILNQIGGSTSPGICYIDANTINVMSRNQFIVNPMLPIVQASNGLLHSPYRQEKHITLDILFEPRARLSQQLQVLSIVNPYLNNKTCKVSKITHKGIISPVVSGDAVTTLDFYVLDPSATDYQQVTPN